MFVNCSYELPETRVQKKNLLCVANVMKYLKRTQYIQHYNEKHKAEEKGQPQI
jgi:hypothetical protein